MIRIRPRHTRLQGLSGLRRPLSTTASSLGVPSQARAVIVGGGIIGSSVAYHLAKMGMKDVILLEKQQLTAGTTWHAAGLMVTFGSLSETSTEMRKYTKSLYSSLEAETGHATGFMPVGFIELASDADRLEEYRRISSFNRKCGVNVKEISPMEVKERFPLCNIDGVLAGFLVEDDGRVNPVDAATSLAKGAKLHGARIFEGVSVAKINSVPSKNHLDRRVTGVTLEDGSVINAEYVINCTGMWARQFGEQDKVIIPNQAAEHYYLITDSIPEVQPHWPVIEDPASFTYIRPEGGGLMIGLFEEKAAAWNVNRIPDKFSFGEIEPDWERMAPYVEKAMSRVPISMTVGVKKFFCGPESFTPDLAPVVGESPEIQNYFVAAGLNSIGILTGGGIGRAVAHWVIHGRPDVDVTGINANRFHRYQTNPQYRAERVIESLGKVYTCHYPYKPPYTARGAKRSVLYPAFSERGAYFKDVSGWEGADWFDPAFVPNTGMASPSIEKHSFQKSGMMPWFGHWAAEHKACRESAIVMDMSFMSKFLVQGRDAGRFLNRLSTANVDDKPDTITYTQWLNQDGKMEADVTVIKMGDSEEGSLEGGKYMVVVTDTMHRHAETWMRRHVSEGSVNGQLPHVSITDVTGGYTQLNIQGPLSRQILAQLTDADLSNEAFPFRTAKEVAIGFARVLCVRVTYVGELGYELHIPTEFALHVYERVVQAGEKFGMRHAGLKSLGSLRLEKAYKDYGHDMDNTDTLLEVGLGFTADMKKAGGFIGKEHVQAQREQLKLNGGLAQRVVQVLVKDPEPMLFHGEVLFRDGECVGDVRVGSYGHTLGGAVGLAHVCPGEGVMVNKDYLATGDWQVEIAGKRYPVALSLDPMYDPKNARIRG